jgi:CHASE2 domain-containing sensor protein
MRVGWRDKKMVLLLAAVQAGKNLDADVADAWLNYYGPSPALTRVSLGMVLKLNGQTTPPGFFSGKIVFIGNDPSTAPAQRTGGFVQQPYGLIAGVELVATISGNLLAGDWLRRASTPRQCLVAFIFGLTASIILVFCSRKKSLLIAAALLLFLLTTARAAQPPHR